MDKKPNFFIIGAAKCGTTALSEYLRAHPNVFFSTPKELCFFGKDYPSHARPIHSIKKYLTFFEKAKPNHIAIGEGSTRYLFSKDAVPEILSFNPNAKFIVMLRNPVDMFLSLYNQLSSTFLETAKTPKEAWQLQGIRKKKSYKPPLLCPTPRDLYYSDRCKLGTLIERFCTIAPRENIHIIFYEDFRTDILATYKGVLTFLGIPYDQRKNFPKINANKTLNNPKLRLAFKFLFSTFRFKRKIKLDRIAFPKLSNFLRKKYIALCYDTSKPKQAITDEFRATLKNHFKEDILKLSKLTNRDLTYWIN